MYERITGSRPYETPMRIYPASHYTMGGLWVDYELQTTIPVCSAAGEANFSDHGANRLGRLGADAGAVRRLLRASVHDCSLPCGLLNKPIPDETHEAFKAAEVEAQATVPGVSRHRRHQGPRPLPP